MHKKSLLVICCLILGLVSLPDANAQIITMGSDLSQPPTFDIGCETKPVIINVNGDYGLTASGTNDCTWRQSGVFGVTSGDGRFSSVPGDGRITSVRVRSGPNPAPLVLSVLRQLSTPGFGAEAQCCFFVTETNVVQPLPNTITTFATNIPVQRNTINGFLAVDLFGISARSGTGALPLRVVGSTNAFALTQPGSVNAGFFYPRIGALGNDVGGGRREDGIPGVELLVQWTWCPASAGPLCRPGLLGPLLNNRNIRVARNRAPIDILCNENQICRGLIEIISRSRRSNRTINNRSLKVYGKANYSVQSGKSKIIRVNLNEDGQKLMKASGRVNLAVRLKPKNKKAKTRTTNVVLRRPN